MYFRPRHRHHGAYPLAREHTLPRGLRLLLAAGAALFAAYLLWTLLLKILGIGGSVERVGAMLTVDDRGTVTVSIDGTEQRATSGMMVFPGESVTTSGGARAGLQFFDGTRARLDDAGYVKVSESNRGEDESAIRLELEQGTLWMMTATNGGYSGSIIRGVNTSGMNVDLPAGTEATISPNAIVVFSTDGAGATVSLSGHDDFVISEGQQWILPAGMSVGDDVFAFRAPIDLATARTAFVTDSRKTLPTQSAAGSSSSHASIAGILTLTAPANGFVLREPALTVQGSIGPDVVSVTVNGYPAIVDETKRTFSQQVSPPEGEGDFEIAVQALDADRVILAEERRTITRGPAGPLPAPTVTAPAKTGQTYNTSSEELILRGTAPAGAAGIMVNDYKLQLFDPLKGEWSYVASLRLRNMVPGTNVYDVYALDGAGKKSDPARITIVQGTDAPNGVVTGTSSSAATTQSSNGPLPTNAPLEPGTLTVTAPTAGTQHVETGTGFLIEGTTSAKTATIAVNDYTLQLYRAGKTTWNYIAEAALNNLKPGKNEYVVVARNAKGEIVDTLTYTVQYEPKK